MKKAFFVEYNDHTPVLIHFLHPTDEKAIAFRPCGPAEALYHYKEGEVKFTQEASAVMCHTRVGDGS